MISVAYEELRAALLALLTKHKLVEPGEFLTDAEILARIEGAISRGD